MTITDIRRIDMKITKRQLRRIIREVLHSGHDHVDEMKELSRLQEFGQFGKWFGGGSSSSTKKHKDPKMNQVAKIAQGMIRVGGGLYDIKTWFEREEKGYEADLNVREKLLTIVSDGKVFHIAYEKDYKDKISSEDNIIRMDPFVLAYVGENQ